MRKLRMAKKSRAIDTRFLKHPLTIAIIVIRVSFALYMFISPIWGYLLTVIWDYLDAVVLLHIEHVSRKQYHYVDKNLDFVYFTVMLIIGFTTSARVPLLVLFLYRLIGHVLFMRTGADVYFVLFPNFFEIVFVWVVLGQVIGFSSNLDSSFYWSWLIVLFLAKEIHEFSLHYLWANYLVQKEIT